MCDTYACCPVIQDGDFIGKFLGQQAEHGSIIVIHMPEHGFRASGRLRLKAFEAQEWCLRGIQELLAHLKSRGLKAVTVGHLAQLAEAQSHL